MKKMNLKLAGLALLIFVLAACSNKTTEATTTGAAQTKERVEKRGERGERGERPQFADLVAKMDTNKDGKLSATEVQGPLKERFSVLDTDNDGFLSEAEFKAAPKPQGRRGN